MSSKVSDLEIVTFNVRGLSDFSKRKDIFDFLRCQTADVICLQEVHVSRGNENSFRNQWGGRAWFSANSSTTGGVGILIQNKSPCKFIKIKTDDKGSAIFLTLEIHEVQIKIINVYGPSNRDDPSFFEEVFTIALSDQTDHMIFCGDWNLTLNPSVDTYNYVGQDRRARSRKLLESKCKDLDLHDAWRIINGDKLQYTWRKSNPLKCARLDFFLVTHSLLNKTLSCEILPAYRTDHSRVSLRLKLTSQTRGRGFWKFNCSLLKEPDYLKLTKQVIVDTIKRYACPIYSEDYMSSLGARESIQLTISDDLFLETLLMNVRSETISFSIKTKKEKSDRERMLIKELNKLESLSKPSSGDIQMIDQKQMELKNLRNPANEGRIIRSRVRWYEEGERGSSSYFLKLEKRNFEDKLMPCLEIGERVIHDSNEILNALGEHYSKLFRRECNNADDQIDEYLKETKLTKLSGKQAKMLDEEITVDELGKTLMKLSNNKSPGSDGFPYEFFKVFWIEVKFFIFRSLKHGIAKGELSITQREGHITLVPKPLKPRNLITSWRPITLLNSTYKILSATIANRLKGVLSTIIHTDQTAFLKNRFIGENTRVVYDVLWEAYRNDKKGILLSVDFKTAFDVMSWEFIERCLRYFNFGDKFIDMFWCLHKNTFSRVVYNGHASKEIIKLERGCRQGDPVSCYLFIIGAEVLASKVRQNADVRGIRLREECIKLVQYADDTTFFLDGTEKSLRAVFGELGWYAKFSGLKPNVSKCNAMWIGNQAFSESRLCPEIELTWVTKIKLLGIIFTPKCDDIVEQNIALKKEAIAKIIGMWQKRHLSLIGKIVITKTLLLSQLTHVLSSLPNPKESTIKDINKLLFSFVWGSKRNPIKRMRLCQPMANCGLEMIDLKSYLMSLKIKWVKRYLTEKDRTWHSLAPNLFQGKFVWNFGVTSLKKICNEVHNPFWKDTLSAWISFTKALDIPEEMIANENVFNSEHTKFKITSYHSWESKGLRYIGDLFEGNRLMTWERFKEVYKISCNFMEYYGLVHSLPKKLQKDQAGGWYQERPIIPARIHYILSNASFTKFFARSIFRNDRRRQEDVERIKNKWLRDINSFEQCSALWVKICVPTTKYTAFQFKLTMRILTTNTFLFLINKREDSKCTFCEGEPETIVHLFLRCRYVATFWSEIGRYLAISGMGELSESHKMFGKVDSPMITHIVTLAKYMIYGSRRNEKRPNFANFKARLKMDFDAERQIAIKNNTLECFNKKWSLLKQEWEVRT